MKVLIADDHRLIIEGVKLKLAELDPGIEAVVAMNLDELDRAVAAHADDLEIFAFHGILAGYKSEANWFTGVTVTLTVAL